MKNTITELAPRTAPSITDTTMDDTGRISTIIPIIDMISRKRFWSRICIIGIFMEFCSS